MPDFGLCFIIIIIAKAYVVQARSRSMKCNVKITRQQRNKGYSVK